MIGYFVGWLGLIIANMPVAFSLIVMGLSWLVIEGQALTSAPQRLIGGIDSFPLLAVPCFILAGIAMNTGGVTERIYGFARALVGHFTGGLGHVNVTGSLIFSGMSGSAIADAGGLGLLEIKAMKEDGYPADFAGALTCASCIIGPLVPPSIPMVLYGVIANASVGALFLAGIVPGLLTALFLMVHVYFYARRRNFPRHPRSTLPQLWAAFRRAFLALVTPVIIMGGIFGGIFTPTESAAIACVWAFFVTVVIYRDYKLAELPHMIGRVVRTVGMVMIMIGFSVAFGYMMAIMRIPAQATELFVAISPDKYTFLFYVNVLLLVLGTFMDLAPMLLICTPIFMPVIAKFGIDPVHFGIVMIFNLGIGLLTPPVGPTLAVGCAIGKVSMEAVSRSIMVFYVPMLVVLGLVTYIPALTLWLPQLLLGR